MTGYLILCLIPVSMLRNSHETSYGARQLSSHPFDCSAFSFLNYNKSLADELCNGCDYI